jgi:peptidoglycan/LPS O-acetylase OafA/YrhL
VLGAGHLLGGRFLFTAGYTLEGVAVVLLLCHLSENPPGRLDRALSVRPLVAMGGISFSLYLWQQLFCGSANTTISGVFPLSIAFTFAAAVLTRVLVEKPFLQLKDRFSRVTL